MRCRLTCRSKRANAFFEVMSLDMMAPLTTTLDGDVTVLPLAMKEFIAKVTRCNTFYQHTWSTWCTCSRWCSCHRQGTHR
jgi:hypothetical protein